jgi:Flp pilus assembly protein TadD
VKKAHELFKQGQVREALALLRPLLQRKGEVDADAAALAAACLGMEGRFDEAARIDRMMCDAHPTNPQGWNSLGYDLLQAGDLKGAHGAYARAVELEPARASAHYNLARILARMGDRSKALEHFLKAVELQPEYRERLDEDPDLRLLKDHPDLLARLPGRADAEDPYASWYATES